MQQQKTVLLIHLILLVHLICPVHICPFSLHLSSLFGFLWSFLWYFHICPFSIQLSSGVSFAWLILILSASFSCCSLNFWELTGLWQRSFSYKMIWMMWFRITGKKLHSFRIVKSFIKVVFFTTVSVYFCFSPIFLICGLQKSLFLNYVRSQVWSYNLPSTKRSFRSEWKIRKVIFIFYYWTMGCTYELMCYCESTEYYYRTVILICNPELGAFPEALCQECFITITTHTTQRLFVVMIP